MNLIIISQDKKSMWDFSQCCLFIPNDSIHEIFIRPYYATNGVSIATYEDPKKTEDVLKEIINLFSNSKMLLTPKINMRLEDIENAKKYFDNLNGEKFIVSDSNFDINPIGNNYNLIYKLPDDNITIGIDLGQDTDKTFETLATIDAGSISRTKNGMYF